MLDELSPRKVSVTPLSRPAASWMVSRSARIWQGWNWSVSAFTTGTELAAASSASCSWPKVRQTMADTCRLSTRPRSLDGLAAPGVGAGAVDDQRVAAQLGDAGRERHPGAQRRLVEDDGDGARPGQRLVREPVGLEPGGQRQHLGLLGRGQVVVAQEVPRPGCARSSRLLAGQHAGRVEDAGQRRGERWPPPRR